MPRSVTVRAPGKVNLQLSVGPLRADGYHPLCTIFQAVSLFDDVTVAAAEPGSGIRVEVTGEDAATVPRGPDNLAARAAAAIANHLGRAPDVTIRIDKHIPVAGGMAGGSADAAAALVACSVLWQAPDAPLIDIAATLGSDVPFPLLGGTAIGTGRGDRLTPLPGSGRYEWLFATASEGLATPAVFRHFDTMPATDDLRPNPPLLAALEAADAQALGRALTNDLQPAALALRPELATVLEAGDRAGALGALVSGSGPTCAFLLEPSRATGISRALQATGLCRSLHRAHGPVRGAYVYAM